MLGRGAACISAIPCLEANTAKLYCENVGFAVRPDNPTVGSISQLLREEEELGRGPNNSVGEHTSVPFTTPSSLAPNTAAQTV